MLVFAELEFGDENDGYWVATVDIVMPCTPFPGLVIGEHAVIDRVFWLGGNQFRVCCSFIEAEVHPLKIKFSLIDDQIGWEFSDQKLEGESFD